GFDLGGFAADDAAALVASAPGYEPAQVAAVAGETEPVRIVLLTTSRLSGSVIADPERSAVRDFTVAISTRRFGVFDRPVSAQRLEGRAVGACARTHLPRDTVTVAVRTAGRAPWSSSVDLSEGAVDLGEIRLPSPATVEGVAVDPLGAPLAGVSIRVARG